MSDLRLQTRLAADILSCGKGRVWIDPNALNEVGGAKSRTSVKRLISDGVIIRKPVLIRSRFRWRKRMEAKKKGRHTGLGKRRGTREARNPTKDQWIRRMRILRRLLKKYRDNGKVDKHLYRELYMKVKGNVFKSKKNLMEYIFKAKAEKQREKQLKEQMEAKKKQVQASLEKSKLKEQRRNKKVIREAEEAAKIARDTQKKSGKQ